jgi:hypothetical protein
MEAERTRKTPSGFSGVIEDAGIVHLLDERIWKRRIREGIT